MSCGGGGLQWCCFFGFVSEGVSFARARGKMVRSLWLAVALCLVALASAARTSGGQGALQASGVQSSKPHIVIVIADE